MDDVSNPPAPGPARPAAGLAWLSSLLCLDGGLLALYVATDSTVLLTLFAVVALVTFAVGVALAARSSQARTRASVDTVDAADTADTADTARLDELEPLPPGRPDAPGPDAAQGEGRG